LTWHKIENIILHNNKETA